MGRANNAHEVTLEKLLVELSGVRGVEEILLTVRKYARALVQADGITFVLRDNGMCFYAEEDAISPLWKGQRFPLDRCISGWAMLNRQAVIIDDIAADPRIPQEAYRPTFVKSLVMVPVRADDPIAAIGAYWAQRARPSEDAVRMLLKIANSAAVAFTNVSLVNSLLSSREEALRAKHAVVFAMAALAATRDAETGNHIRRTQHYVRELATAAQTHAAFRDQIDDQMIDLLFGSAPLHDIGKVGIPDRILLKPGKLDDNEFAVMKTHTELGRQAIELAQGQLGGSNAFLRIGAQIAYSHHEKWNGSGYPLGLSGADIPLSGRLMAVADAYDAIVSVRSYKPARSHEDAVSLIMADRGRHFDPHLVDIFTDVAPAFDAIRRTFSDSSPTLARNVAA